MSCSYESFWQDPFETRCRRFGSVVGGCRVTRCHSVDFRSRTRAEKTDSRFFWVRFCFTLAIGVCSTKVDKIYEISRIDILPSELAREIVCVRARALPPHPSVVFLLRSLDNIILNNFDARKCQTVCIRIYI